MTAGIVFDIQTGCIHDGPGIRTCVFVKGCPLRCAWCHNPESWKVEPEIGYLAERCTACGACIDACQNGAIALDGDRVVRDAAKCVVCGACAEACPGGATEVIGKEMTPEEVAGLVLRDKPFYDGSGGGVTFTGGEATTQPEFLIETAQRLRDAGVHVALETCGVFPAPLLDDLASVVDLFLFDLKHVDPETHRRSVGAGSDVVLDRFRAVLARVGAARVAPRVPVIPGFNAQPEALAGIAAFLREAGYAGEVHLMPYNRLAKSKWEKVGRPDGYRDLGELPADRLRTLARELELAGFLPVVSE